MKKVSIYLVSLLFFLQSSILFSYSSDPKDFVNEVITEAINKLSDKNLNKEQKKLFIEKVALKTVDINALGLYTLGELRKTSNKNDIENYQETFSKIFF